MFLENEFTNFAKYILSDWVACLVSVGKLYSACTNEVDISEIGIILTGLKLHRCKPFVFDSLKVFASFSRWALQFPGLSLNFLSFSFKSIENLTRVHVLLVVRFMVSFCVDMKSLDLIGLNDCNFSDKILKWIHRKTLASLVNFHVESAGRPTDEHKLTERSARNISEHCRCLENVTFKFYNDWDEYSESFFSLTTANFMSLFSNNPSLISVKIECAGDFKGSLLQVIAQNCKQLLVIHVTTGRLKMFCFSEVIGLLNGCDQLTSVNLRDSPNERDDSCKCFRYERPATGESELVLSSCHGYSLLAVKTFFDSFGGFIKITLNDLTRVSNRLVNTICEKNPSIKSLIISNCAENADHVKRKVTVVKMFRFVELIMSDSEEVLKFEAN
jgi:hypothetical protein